MDELAAGIDGRRFILHPTCLAQDQSDRFLDHVHREWLSEHGAFRLLQELLGFGAHRVSSNKDHARRRLLASLKDLAPDRTAVHVR